MVNYSFFIQNEGNIMNCSQCPWNKNETNEGGKLKCGQYECWVYLLLMSPIDKKVSKEK